MKKSLLTYLSLGMIAAAGFISSCNDDENFAAPTVSLSETEVTANPGDEVSVTVTTTTDAGFKTLVVTKNWDGVKQDEETFSAALTAPYVYTVTDEDADHITTINFTVTDSKGKTAAKELVVTVELTPRQVLLKYNWRLNAEIREKTGVDEIQAVYKDDVYRFNADGTYNKSIGAQHDDWNDLLYNYCYYDLSDNTLTLLLSRVGGWDNDDVTDTLRVTIIDATKMHADVNYIGLEVFDPTYDHVEKYDKQFVAVPKTSDFDPYMPGAEDDATGPYECHDVTFENE